MYENYKKIKEIFNAVRNGMLEAMNNPQNQQALQLALQLVQQQNGQNPDALLRLMYIFFQTPNCNLSYFVDFFQK